MSSSAPRTPDRHADDHLRNPPPGTPGPTTLTEENPLDSLQSCEDKLEELIVAVDSMAAASPAPRKRKRKGATAPPSSSRPDMAVEQERTSSSRARLYGEPPEHVLQKVIPDQNAFSFAGDHEGEQDPCGFCYKIKHSISPDILEAGVRENLA